MSNNLKSLLTVPFKWLGKKASRGIIQFLLKMPTNNKLDKILRLLLDNLEDEPIKTRHDFIMHFKQSGHSTNLRKTLVMGLHEKEYLNFIKKIIKSGEYVADIGAHEGYFSLYMASLVGKDGMIFSIEPNKENLWFLERNVQYNNANIQIIEKAVSNEINESNFIYDDGMGAWGSLVDFSYFSGWFKEKRTMKVQVDTLDNLFEHAKKRIKFVKIDTEGNELNVFLGAKKFLSKHKPIVCFEVNMLFWSYLDHSVDTLFKIFNENGYELYVLEKNALYKFRYLDKPVTNIFAVHQSYKNELSEKGIIFDTFFD